MIDFQQHKSAAGARTTKDSPLGAAIGSARARNGNAGPVDLAADRLWNQISAILGRVAASPHGPVHRISELARLVNADLWTHSRVVRSVVRPPDDSQTTSAQNPTARASSSLEKDIRAFLSAVVRATRPGLPTTLSSPAVTPVASLMPDIIIDSVWVLTGSRREGCLIAFYALRPGKTFSAMHRDALGEFARHVCKPTCISTRTPGAIQTLSPRLREVYGELMAGISRREIATRMGLSVHTVNDYIKDLYRRLGVSSLTDLIRRRFEGTEQ